MFGPSNAFSPFCNADTAGPVDPRASLGVFGSAGSACHGLSRRPDRRGAAPVRWRAGSARNNRNAGCLPCAATLRAWCNVNPFLSIIVISQNSILLFAAIKSYIGDESAGHAPAWAPARRSDEEINAPHRHTYRQRLKRRHRPVDHTTERLAICARDGAGPIGL